MRVLIQGGLLFGQGESKDILLENGVITKIEDSVSGSFDRVIDARGLAVSSGLIDMHTHLREPGYEHKENIYTGTKAAAKGGFTSVCCMPNTRPVCDNESVVIYIKDQAAKANLCRVFPIGAITKGLQGKELAEIGCMKKEGIVAISDDGNPVENSQLMRLAMEYADDFGVLVISHCEDKNLVADGLANEGFHGTKAGLRGNTRAAEEVIVAREIVLAETLGTRIHIAHVSTKGSVELIRQAKKRGVKVTCETCPHYFILDDSLLESFDTNLKVNPPIRTKEDVLAIIEGIKEGVIDCIVTDHAPHHKDEKNVEFQYAMNGISGLETAFALSYSHLVKAGHIPLSKLFDLMSKNPAEILGLGLGRLEIGSTDISIFDLNTSYKIDTSKFLSKGKNSPFNDYEVYGSVMYTIIGENIIECEELR
ncbi:MAG TPA: dihydroorotase [Clostridiales bacterium]|jgi:dihydroorotase|nr:dihydroorotase [Clostridiales bacterium]